jgi:hypothetical protein
MTHSTKEAIEAEAERISRKKYAHTDDLVDYNKDQFYAAKDMARFISTLPRDEVSSAGKWISVNDRLPNGQWSDSEQEYIKKYSEQVNVYVSNGVVGTAAYNRESKKWFIGGLTPELGYYEFERTQVISWQPLPEPPQITKHNQQ